MDEVLVLIALLIILFGSGIVGLIIALANRGRIQRLETEVSSLKTRLTHLLSRDSSLVPEPSTIEHPALFTEHFAASAPGTNVQAPHNTEVPAPAPAPAPAASLTIDTPREDRTLSTIIPTVSSWSDTLSSSFARYWTGILGTLALVTGLSFLGVLTALRFTAFPRFLMIVAVAIILLATAFVLKRNVKQTEKPDTDKPPAMWRINLAAWLRAAGGALILFSAIAASSVPALRWVESELQGYVLLFVAIALNVWLSIRSPVQAQLSFHSIISLVALAVAPPSGLSLAAALSASFITTLPAARRGWNWHLIIAEGAFFAFTFLWRTGPLPEYPPLIEGSALRFEGLLALAALILAITPILVIAWLPKTRLGGRSAIIARILAWVILAAGILSFSSESRLFAPLFLLGALAAWLIPLFPGKTKRPEWLRILDTLAALGLGLAASFSLIRFEPDMLTVLSVAFAFVVAMSLSRGNLRIVTIVCDIALTGIVGFSFAYFFNILANRSWNTPNTLLFSDIWGTSLYLSLLFTLTLVSLILKKQACKRPLAGLLLAIIPLVAGFFPSGGIYLPGEFTWLNAGPLTLLLPLAILAAAFLSATIHRHLAWLKGGFLALAGARLVSLLAILIEGSEFTISKRLIWASSFLLTVFAPFIYTVLARRARARLMQVEGMPYDHPNTEPLSPGQLHLPPFHTGIAVFAGGLTLALVIKQPYPAITAIALSLYTLILAPLHHLIKNDVHRNIAAWSAFGLQILVSFLLVFLIEPFCQGFISIQERAYSSLAFPIASLSLAVWAFFRPPSRLRTISIRAAIVSALLFTAMKYGLNKYSADHLFLPAALLALALLGIPRLVRLLSKKPFAPTLLSQLDPLILEGAGHSWWAWLAALGALFALLVSGEFPDIASFTIGLAAILAYTILAIIPEAFPRKSIWQERFTRYPARFFLWPLCAVSALGLFIGPHATGLSILLFIESLAIFSLGLFLHDRTSRPASWTFLILGFLRIFFVDLARADTLGRALIFIVAGLCLLSMNFIYNRFSVEKKGKEKI